MTEAAIVCAQRCSGRTLTAIRRERRQPAKGRCIDHSRRPFASMLRTPTHGTNNRINFVARHVFLYYMEMYRGSVGFQDNHADYLALMLSSLYKVAPRRFFSIIIHSCQKDRSRIMHRYDMKNTPLRLVKLLFFISINLNTVENSWVWTRSILFTRIQNFISTASSFITRMPLILRSVRSIFKQYNALSSLYRVSSNIMARKPYRVVTLHCTDNEDS